MGLKVHSGVFAAVRLQLDGVAQQAAGRLFDEVRNAAPVDSGALRDSITLSVNALPSSFGGRAAVKAGDKVFVSTDKVYAPVIEYGLYPNPPKRPTGKTENGYSVQAPNGFMRISALNVAAWAKGMKWT